MGGDRELLPVNDATGQSEGLEELLYASIPRVRSLIDGMVLNGDDADDLTQEVMLRALRGLRDFDGRSHLSTWLHRIALNTAYTFLAGKNRRRMNHSPLDADIPDNRASGPGELQESELDDPISKALGELSPPLRAAIVLTVIQDVSPAEAARIEGCTRATMYWRLHQARKLLRERLSEFFR